MNTQLRNRGGYRSLRKSSSRNISDGNLLFAIFLMISLIVGTEFYLPSAACNNKNGANEGIKRSSLVSKKEVLKKQAAASSLEKTRKRHHPLRTEDPSVFEPPPGTTVSAKDTGTSVDTSSSQTKKPGEGKEGDEEQIDAGPSLNSAVKSSDHNSRFPIIDVVSIGSRTRPEYQQVQKHTFLRHRSVRNSLLVDESIDADTDCLESANVSYIFDICHEPKTYRRVSLMKRHFAQKHWLLVKHPAPRGWLCAQKRPLDALHLALLKERQQSESLPDYLVILDDDTWMHWDRLIPVLKQEHPASEPHVVAGCLIRSPKNDTFTFHWGGFGLILTKATLERLLTPLLCTEGIPTSTHQENHVTNFASNEEFAMFACDRLSLNLIGEKNFYQKGMSLMDIIYQYSYQQPYSKAAEWDPTARFCMHSDTTLAYFFQYYHVGLHAGNRNFPHRYGTNPLERMISFHNSTKIKVSPDDVKPPKYESYGECLHLTDVTCANDDSSYICHYVSPYRIKQLHSTTFHNSAYRGNFRPITPEGEKLLQSLKEPMKRKKRVVVNNEASPSLQNL